MLPVLPLMTLSWHSHTQDLLQEKIIFPSSQAQAFEPGPPQQSSFIHTHITRQNTLHYQALSPL
jgi:hypothetical protein